jgi:predicted RNase H-like HicB family nuclease
MKVKAFIERGNDGSYGVYVDLEDTTLNYGIIGDGKTVTEAIDDFHNSYKEMKDSYASENKYFEEAEFEFKYDTASFLAYYSKILSLAGLGRLTGIAQGQLSHYVTGRRKPSPKTTKKIEDSLHKFGADMLQLELTN